MWSADESFACDRQHKTDESVRFVNANETMGNETDVIREYARKQHWPSPKLSRARNFFFFFSSIFLHWCNTMDALGESIHLDFIYAVCIIRIINKSESVHNYCMTASTALHGRRDTNWKLSPQINIDEYCAGGLDTIWILIFDSFYFTFYLYRISCTQCTLYTPHSSARIKPFAAFIIIVKHYICESTSLHTYSFSGIRMSRKTTRHILVSREQ